LFKDTFAEMLRLRSVGEMAGAGHLEGESLNAHRELDDNTEGFQQLQLHTLRQNKEKAAQTLLSNHLVSFGMLALASLVALISYVLVRPQRFLKRTKRLLRAYKSSTKAKLCCHNGKTLLPAQNELYHWLLKMLLLAGPERSPVGADRRACQQQAPEWSTPHLALLRMAP
jgi:hypothetical protein